MKPNRKKYQLSEKTLDSVLGQTDAIAKLDLNKNGKAGNTFLVIDQNSGEIQFIIPYKLQGNFYAAHFPSPVQLFFKQSLEHKTKAEAVAATFEENIEWLYCQEENSSQIKMVNSDIFDQFIIHKISCLTALISTIEAFSNETIPNNFKILNAKNIEVGKAEVERQWDLKSKLKQVIPKIVTIDSKQYEICVDKFLEMNYLRNEFIHMKFKTDNRNFDPYLDNFRRLINLDLKKSILEVKMLINIVKPNYW